jgi:hypothetical protein
MNFRLFPLFLLFAVALLPSGCASTEEASDDQLNTFQSTPEKPEDSHGWGANVGGLGGQQ